MEIFVLLFAYVIGSIPFGLLVGKVGYGIDIRDHGSGNLGGTNTFRVLGIKAGLVVTISDMLKGTIAASLPFYFGLDHMHSLLVGSFAVIGHTYPLFAKFKGGKAVATSAGVVLFYAPILFVSLLVVFFISLYVSKYVSLSSMVASLYAVIYAIVISDKPLIIAVCLLAGFIFYRHRSNIKRILEKTEPKIKWM